MASRWLRIGKSANQTSGASTDDDPKTAPEGLDCWKLCSLPVAQVAPHLREVAKKLPRDVVQSFLEEAVNCGGLPPYVLEIWLSLNRTLDSLLASVNSESAERRRVAIKRLGKLHKGPMWEEIWTAIGGIPGWLALFENSSVADVQMLVKSLRMSHKGLQDGQDNKKKRDMLTELTKALLPTVFPDAQHKSKDTRQLSRRYLALVPVCNSDFVLQTLCKLRTGDTWTVRTSRELIVNCTDQLLFANHAELCRGEVLASMLDPDHGRPYAVHWRQPFLNSYPVARSTKFPKWSAPMEFAFEALQKLADSNVSALNERQVLDDVALPLLQRALSWKKFDRVLARDIFTLTLDYVERHPSCIGMLQKKRSYGSKPGFLDNLLAQWSADVEFFQSTLRRLFVLFSKAHETRIHLYQSGNLLESVSNSLRYTLLQMIGQYAYVPALDLQSVSDLKRLNGKVWNYDIFSQLANEQASDLVGKLQQANVEDLCVSVPYSLSTQSALFRNRTSGSTLDVDLYCIKLRDGSPEAVRLAAEKVEYHSNIARTTRDRDERIRRAAESLLYAVVSKDLKLVRKVFDMNKRYAKDFEAWHNLFDEKTLTLTEHVHVLGGSISANNRDDFETFKNEVQAGTELLNMYLDLAIEAIKEPFFQPRCLLGVYQLFKNVLDHRLALSVTLRAQYNLSDRDLCSFLMEYAGHPFLRAEDTCIDELPGSFKSICAKNPIEATDSFEDLPPGVASFVDELGRVKDQRWAHYRKIKNPDVAVIRTPWPQGLTISQLRPNNWFPRHQTHRETHLHRPTYRDIPYLIERAERIVFMSEKEAMSQYRSYHRDKGAYEYHDNYQDCLSLYILSAPQSEQTQRFMKAWEHATTTLSTKFNRTEEIHAFWRRYFTGFTVGDKPMDGLLAQLTTHYYGSSQTSNLPGPVMNLPDDPDFDHLNDWDPRGPEVIHSKSHQKEYVMTAIDCCLETSTYGSMKNIGSFWWYDRVESHIYSKSEDREARIAVGLLLRDMQIGGKAGILRTAFPDPQQFRRFPPLMLDADYLAEQKNPPGNKRQDIESWLPSCTPPQLLRDLIESGLRSIKEQELAKKQDPSQKVSQWANNITMECLGLLIKSERVDLALDLTFDALTSLPDASSWHRHFLNTGLLKKMQSNQVYDTVSSFASHFIKVNDQRMQSLEKFKNQGLDEDAIQAETQKLPFVKITTIKMVAELLRDSEIFGFEQALGLLHEIFEKFRHVDIRCALLTSLTTLIESFHSVSEFSDEAWNKIFDILRTLSGCMGGFSERQPAEDKSDKPATNEPLPAIDNEFPIWNALLMIVQSGDRLPKRLRDFVYTDILLPTLAKSTASNRWYLASFAKQHRLAVDLQGLALSAITPAEQGSINTFRQILDLPTSYLTQAVAESYTEICMLLIDPPQAVLDASHKVKSDVKLRSSPSAKHWLTNLPCRGQEHGISGLISFLYQQLRITLLEKSSLTVDFIQGHILSLAEKAWELETRGRPSWGTIVSEHLNWSGHYPGENVKQHERWTEVFTHIGRQLLALDKKWRTMLLVDVASKRYLSELPSTLPLRLSLVKCPMRGRHDSAGTQRFVAEMTQVLHEVYREHPVTCYKHFDDFLGYFTAIGTENDILATREFCKIDVEALTRGDDDSRFATTKLDLGSRILRKQMASSRFKTHSTGEEAVHPLKELVDSWIKCPVEEVSNWGIEFSTAVRWHAGDGDEVESGRRQVQDRWKRIEERHIGPSTR